MLKAIILYTIGIIITPYLVMVIGLIIMLVGAFSTSPVINALRFRSRKFFLDYSQADEDEEEFYNISWKDSLTIFLIGLVVFISSLIIGSFWEGIIYNL
jgi:hypothetical protein